MAAFGLVLGGGGPVGAAWYAGLASGLAEDGIDLGLADVIMGTSAGAWAGGWLAINADLIAQVSSVMGRAEAPLEPPETQLIGELAMQVPPIAVRFYANHLP